MSCPTHYVVREVDGTSWSTWFKNGPCWFDTPDEARRFIQDCRGSRGAQLLEPGMPLERFGCQGVGLDARDRRLRFWECRTPSPKAAYLESLEHRLRAAAAWREWQVEVAWGGQETLLEIQTAEGEADSSGPPSQRVDVAALLIDQPEHYPNWDPVERELQVRYVVPSPSWFSGMQGLFSVICEDLSVVDYQFSASLDEALLWLGAGPTLLDVVAGRTPCDVGSEEWVTEGAVVDVPGRTLRLWSPTPLAPSAWRRLTGLWSGWRLARLPGCYAGQLAATGRHAEVDRLTADDELVAAGFDASWVAWRRNLRCDERALRPPRIRIVNG